MSARLSACLSTCLLARPSVYLLPRANLLVTMSAMGDDGEGEGESGGDEPATEPSAEELAQLEREK